MSMKTGTAWLDQIWKAKQAKKGGICRRKRTSVEKHASVALLTSEVKNRGFHLVESGDQFLVLCNKGIFKLHC